MPKSIRVNYIYNLVNTITNTLFPLITFPYVTHIMGAEGFGRVNFLNSIISYIIMLAGLGIPLYAIREIARVRNNPKILNQTTAEILVLHTILTLVGYVIVLLLCFIVPKIYQDAYLFLLLSSSLVFTTIGCEWFYQGIEDFKYVTIRAVIVRVICIILLFIFVKSKDDIMLYGLYCVLGTVGNNLLNFLHLKKYINRKYIDIKNFNPIRHLKSVSMVFILIVVSTVYISLNTVLLGFLKNSTAVGYYTAGIKIFTILFGIINSLTSILIPHFSNLIALKKEEEFRIIVQKVYNFVIAISFPLTIGLIFVSPYAIILLCGEDFRFAILVSQITAPMLFIVGLSNVFGMQILYPLGKINIIIKSVIIASVVDILTIIILSPRLSHVAAALGYLLAEITATLFEYLMGKKYIPIMFFNKGVSNYIIASIIMAVVLYFVTKIESTNLFMTISILSAGLISYLLSLLILKDSLLKEGWEVIKSKL